VLKTSGWLRCCKKESCVLIIDQNLLDRISAEARENPRLRKNFNLHAGDDFCCHRLLNAMEPGSYIRPHRHLDPAKDESMVMVRGRMGVLIFDDAGNVRNHVIIGAAGPAVAVDIPHGQFHTVVSLESGTVFFESKAGPYLALTEEEKGGWSPAEGTSEVAGYLIHLRKLLKG
jgi:cupin fold WbuC family metalloprotein